MAEEITARDVELIRLNEKIERLEAIIDLYLCPLEEIFSEDDKLRESAQRAVSRRVEKDREALASIGALKEDIQDMNGRLNALLHRRKPGEMILKRLKITDALLVARNNAPIPFSEMKKLQEFKPKHSRQDMTKLGHVYVQYPEKYEVRESRLGGKTIKLNPSYFKHLAKLGV